MIPEQPKSMVRRTVVRPLAAYGARCWPVTKQIESRLGVTERKVVRWATGFSVSNAFATTPYDGGLVSVSDNDNMARKIGLKFEVSRKLRIRPAKQRRLDRLHWELEMAGLQLDQAFDRGNRRYRTRRSDPVTKRDKC